MPKSTKNIINYIVICINEFGKKHKITSKEAKKYLVGHIGYIRIANVNNLTKKIFFSLFIGQTIGEI